MILENKLCLARESSGYRNISSSTRLDPSWSSPNHMRRTGNFNAGGKKKPGYGTTAANKSYSKS